MVGVVATLKALSRVEARTQKSLWSLTGNNFVIVSALIMQDAGVFIYLLLGLVILFPLAADPLRKIPASRLNALPLTKREHWLLRIGSIWLNPMAWVIGLLAIWTMKGRVTIGLWSVIAALALAGFAVSWLPAVSGVCLFRQIPALPVPLNQLIRKNARELLTTLDFYCALLLSLSVLAFRLTTKTLPNEALVILSVLIVIALSTYSQCLFGLDGKAGISRYRLLPLGGWQVLIAKDVVVISFLILLTLPTDSLAGLGAALIALAIGHHKSVRDPQRQMRWRFSVRKMSLSGAVLALVEAAVLYLAATSISDRSMLFMIPCTAAWLGSLWWYGKQFEYTREFGRY